MLQEFYIAFEGCQNFDPVHIVRSSNIYIWLPEYANGISMSTGFAFN